jgi:hypothetical protein
MHGRSWRDWVGVAFCLLVGCATPDDGEDVVDDTPDTVDVETDEIAEAPPCHAPDDDDVVVDAADGELVASRSAAPVVIDGCSTDAVWAGQDWYGLDHVWMGSAPEPADYQGRFKVAWTADRLLLLVEVVDDVLHPTLADGVENYWKGDYVEVFLDADRSGGDHRDNHQAFAYHVSTEGHAIDKDTSQETVFFDDHVDVVRTQEGSRYLWELAVTVYGDDFDEASDANTPVTLAADAVLGFSLAYGDNDGNQSRENFMGSRATHGVNNDEGYLNADVFGSVRLTE